MLVTLVSVVGSSVFGKPLLGDTEIVELLIGIAIACFMPYCQMRGSNVIVDFFTMKVPDRTRAGIDACMTLVFAIIVAILTERLIQGTFIQYERERVSMFLRLPQWWGYAIASLAVVAAILLIYLILGCFMESLAMVLLTLPVFIPLILSLDLGMSQGQVLVWFGILVPVAVEVGMISPPFGLNLFVINAMAKDVPMVETYKGVLGFCASDVIRLVLLVAFPALSLWLPGIK